MYQYDLNNLSILTSSPWLDIEPPDEVEDE
jgi:hypothetical protein